MAIKAAFFDIDGTLVSFKTHKIPQSTINAITEAKRKGIKIFIATGRPVAIINNIADIEKLVDGYITFNGAYCFMGIQEFVCTPIPEADVQTMITDAERRDYCLLACGKRQVVIHNYKKVFTDIFVNDLGVNNIDESRTIADLKGQPILQLTPFFKQADEDVIMPYMPHCVSARWHPEFTDITMKEANKGNALTTVATRLGIDIADCIAFGDGGNDLSILKAAGIGVAMSNANDEVKAVADYVTTSVDEDGIWNALQYFGAIDKE
ncbi:Cof-type HAD-IIB family hydrolase [Prevotella aurantiaca JCM 15754]|uniref:Cof-type HAD-IIB family hydrolase n=1 Tax=Prevotella aurantiaca TaxID=596085 RepID=UPI00046A9D10|nr:Cof-type HAD-IIB family hydrolase [Prevotella aurantiaca]